jgi:hypothetical protein
MRTRNEKVLAAILVLIVFGAVNFYGYAWLSQKQRALDMKAVEMRADQEEALVDLQKQNFWAQRKDWLQQHEPTLADEGDAKAQVLQGVLKGARDQHLEVLEQTLNDVQHGAAGTQVNVEVKVRGAMQGLCQWLTDLEKPESFYAVSQMSLKADTDQKSMVCTLQIARYFKTKS